MENILFEQKELKGPTIIAVSKLAVWLCPRFIKHAENVMGRSLNQCRCTPRLCNISGTIHSLHN